MGCRILFRVFRLLRGHFLEEQSNHGIHGSHGREPTTNYSNDTKKNSLAIAFSDPL